MPARLNFGAKATRRALTALRPAGFGDALVRYVFGGTATTSLYLVGTSNILTLVTNSGTLSTSDNLAGSNLILTLVSNSGTLSSGDVLVGSSLILTLVSNSGLLSTPLPGAVAFTNRTPDTGATRVAYGANGTIDATPSSALNPIVAATVTVNGVAATVVRSSLGPSGAERIAWAAPDLAGRLNTVVTTVTLSDASVHVDTYTYTTRTAWSPTAAAIDYAAAGKFITAAICDHATRPQSVTAGLVEYAVLPVGILQASAALVDYAVQPAAGGILNAVPGLVDYYAVEPEAWLLVPVGCVPADIYSEPQTVGLSVYGTDHASGWPAGLTIRGTDHQVALYAGVGLKVRRFEVLAYVGTVVAEVHREPTPVGASLDRVTARLTVEAMAVSTRRKEVEEEP